MGKIPSVMCSQETDRHDNESSDKYRRQSSPHSVDPHTAQCSHEGCTGINMFHEDVGFLPCHHVTHQTAAYTGKHSYKHQQEGIIRISIINSRHHTQGCKDSQAYRIHDQHSLVIKSSQSATQKIMFDIQQYKNRQ